MTAKSEHVAALPAQEADPMLAKMREPFPAHQISKLPKETGNQAKQRKADQDNGKWPDQCKVCGGYHHPKAVHLDYVGHAALTDRLLDADPYWSWEPLAFTPEGMPARDSNGGMWIKLTVGNVTRLGYGSADGKSGGDAIKELIGDALRNAAMRFGAALDLWHKGDLHADEGGEEKSPPPEQNSPPRSDPAKPAAAPTLAERANRLESAMRAKVGNADAVQRVFDVNAALCAELDQKNPERLAELTALLNMLLAAPEAVQMAAE